MEPIVDAVPLVPLLDDPVPQTMEQLPDVLQFFGTLTTEPEQVIEVPKILTEDVPMRAVLRATQLAEQLDDGAERRHSSSWSWRAKRRSSRFSSRTGLNCAVFVSGTHFSADRGADR